MKKKILISFILSLCAIFSFAQFPNNSKTGNPTTLAHNTGAITGDAGIVLTRFSDTTTANLNYISGQPGGQIIVGDIVYVRDVIATKWIAIGTGISGDDTIYVKPPLYVFIDSLGRRVIAIQRANGLYSGGVVTQDSCFNLDVSSANYSINFFSYTSANTLLTVSVPDVSNPRIDLVYLDTTGSANIRAGTPAATPSPPSYNPASEIPLAYIYVPASASCLGAITKVIYDGISDDPTQWNVAYSGTITIDTVNTDNPFHLNQAIFVSAYADGSSITFTDAAADTITSTTVFKGHLYLNGALGSNNIQMQLFNTGTPVGNPITLLPYINPNDSNEYQLYQIRAGDFGVIAGNIFNQYKLTFSGNDLSGAKGLYLDYIQLQTGINNIPPPTDYSNKQDSNHTSNDSLFWCVKGVCKYLGQVNGGSACAVTFHITPDSLYLVKDSCGSIIDSTQWIAGSGVSTATKQIYTGTSSVLIANNTNWLILNPASIASAITITLPTAPTDGQVIDISFGGTVTSGTVITSLTISPNSGQTILGSTSYSDVEVEDRITLRYNSTNEKWYK